MSNSKATLRQAELERYLRAAIRAGIESPRVEIKPDGTVIMTPTTVLKNEGDNDWDKAFD